MSLHGAKVFARFIASLPATTLVEQWEAQVAKVGGKVFAMRGSESGTLVFKVSEMSFEGLTALEGIGQAPYFARRHWVAVARGADIDEAGLKAYIAASHGLVASKLTRKLRAELGLG